MSGKQQSVSARRSKLHTLWSLGFVTILPVILSVQGCAPRRIVSRPSLPPAVSPPPGPGPIELAQPRRSPDPETRPLIIEEARIREENLKEKRSVPQPAVKEPPVRPAPPQQLPGSLPDDSSLIAKITPGTPPQRAASLRLTEEGKRLLESGEYAKALVRLERTIALDSRNPYGYYYLAMAHFRMGRYQASLNFLDVAESLLSNEPYWLAEVYALKGENFRGLGHFQQADLNYSRALAFDPGNRMAFEGLARLRGDEPHSPR